MLFRIGINLGDVLIEGDDILGDGVNIAARLEGIAEPGGICISRQVYEQVYGKLAINFRELGPQNLKNITTPVDVFAVDRAPKPHTRGCQTWEANVRVGLIRSANRYTWPLLAFDAPRFLASFRPAVAQCRASRDPA